MRARFWHGLQSLLRLGAVFAALGFLSPHARAVMPDEVLSDPALEARARELSRDLRCLVCQNQSIDDSGAPLARDLRIIVRERLSQGDSNEEVIEYLVARYGNFVLLNPPIEADTLLLWIGPGLILVFAGGAFLTYMRRGKNSSESVGVALTDSERQDIATLTGRSDT